MRLIFLLSMSCVLSALGQVPDASAALPPRDTSLVILSIESDPDSANVYLDSVLVGITPLVLDSIHRRPFQLLIKYPDYYDFVRMVNPGVLDTVRYALPLLPRFGFVNVSSPDTDLEITLDDTLIYEPPIMNLKLRDGEHSVRIVSRSNGRVLKRRFALDPGRIASFGTQMGYFSIRPVLFSMTVPGYGQLKEGAYIKGTGFALVVGAGLYWTLRSDSDYRKADLDYRSHVDSYNAASTEADALELHRRVLASYDRLNKTRRTRNIALTATIAVYALNVVDAFLFHAIEDEFAFLPERSNFKFEPFLSFTGEVHGISISIPL